MPSGRRCGAPPGRKSSYCFWHDPDKVDEVADAQRLGGQRRKRERTIAAAYDFSGLGSVESIGRIFEIATTDLLQLDNSIPRARVLINAGLAALKLLEVGELQARVEVLEQAVASTRDPGTRGGGLLDG